MKKIIIGFSALCLAACQGDAIDETAALANTQWVLKYSQSDIGLKEPVTGLFTVSFDDNSEVEVVHQCGTYTATYTAEHMDTAVNGAVMQIVPMASEELVCDTSELIAYQNKLSQITSYDLTADKLVLKNGDIESLILARRFTQCDSPAPLAGVNDDEIYAPVSVWLTLSDQAASDTANQFDAQYPDFTLLPSSECDTRILASMNRNTLNTLRCDSAVSALAFKN